MPKLENKRFNFSKLLQSYLAESISLRISSPKNSLNWRVNVINTSLFSSPKRVNTLFLAYLNAQSWVQQMLYPFQLTEFVFPFYLNKLRRAQ